MPMAITERQRILLQFTSAREKAEILLRGLLDAKAQSEKHLADTRQRDAVKQVTGRSSMENAIASTQRMIETLSRNITQLRRELSEEDAAMLDEGSTQGH
jgi:hypothetical protein